MAKRSDDATLLSTIQNLLIFHMASAGVPQSEIRKALGLDINRVSKIAKLAKRPKKLESKSKGD